MNEFNSIADMLIERLRSMADGKTSICLYNEISRAAMDMISSVNYSFLMRVLMEIDKHLNLIILIAINRFPNQNNYDFYKY